LTQSNQFISLNMLSITKVEERLPITNNSQIKKNKMGYTGYKNKTSIILKDEIDELNLIFKYFNTSQIEVKFFLSKKNKQYMELNPELFRKFLIGIIIHFKEINLFIGQKVSEVNVLTLLIQKFLYFQFNIQSVCMISILGDIKDVDFMKIGYRRLQRFEVEFRNSIGVYYPQ
jgi:hypothetical protein